MVSTRAITHVLFRTTRKNHALGAIAVLFHINDNGIPETCSSRVGECRVSEIRDHAVTADEALRRYFVKKQKEEVESGNQSIDAIRETGPIEVSDTDGLWSIGRKIAARYPGSELYLGGDRAVYVTIDHIEVPKSQRNAGIGRMMMNDLITLADSQGWSLALSPSRSFGSSLHRLKKFYEDFGFINNGGQNKDTRAIQTMIRPAKG